MNRAERREAARLISETHSVPFATAFSAVSHNVHPEVIARALEVPDLVERRRTFIAATNALTEQARKAARRG